MRLDPQSKLANLLVAAIFIVEFTIIVMAYYAGYLGTATQILIAFITLVISGMAIRKIKGLKGGYGMYMAGGKKGIQAVDRISKRNKSFWKGMATWGIVLGFGVFSYFLLKGKIDKRIFALGLATIGLMLYFMIPCTALPLQFVHVPGVQSYAATAAAACAPSLHGFSIAGYILLAITVLFGFSGFIIGSLLYNAASILTNSIIFAIGSYNGNPQTSLLTGQVPGIAPVIPGIDIPLIAGIASLVIILVIHEFSHGVLARVARVRLKQIGVILFGVIPIGAFVEPDEKAVLKLDKEKQNWISSAGISANFIAAIVFFLVMLAMLAYVVPTVYQNNGVFVNSVASNTPANGVLKAGEQIVYWNGNKINNISDLELAGQNDLPGSMVNVVLLSQNCSPQSGLRCSALNYSIPAVSINGSSRGYIGITAIQEETIANTAYAKAAYFFYTLVSLSFILNFLVALVNLLPIPGFDGWRIYKTNIKNAMITKLVMVLILIGLVLNALPWLYIGLLH